ncbi:transposase [Mesorhizobium sp. M1148]|uniref:transposase n=1 Tax=unclassified Mesorhizobium TaxID=325217 RepID=UPI00333AD89E
MRPLTTIPGVDAITAATVQALVPDPDGFRSGRHLAAWLGLTPRSHSSGGKKLLSGISKMGNNTGAVTERRSIRRFTRCRIFDDVGYETWR